MNKNKKGFTIIELMALMIPILIILVYFICFKTVLAGNMYVTKDGAYEAIQMKDQEISTVDHVQRNCWSYSKAFTTDKDGSKHVYQLDSNILFNVEAVKEVQ